MGQNLVGIVIQSALVGGFFGLTICWIVEGPIAILTKKNKKNAIDLAIEQGHSVKAHLVEYYDDGNYDRRRETYYADYEYYVEGKRYKRTYNFYRKPSTEITLYWINNPKKADTKDVLEQKDKRLHIYVIVCILLVFAISILTR